MTTTLVYVLTSRVHKKSDNNDHIPFIRAISEKCKGIEFNVYYKDPLHCQFLCKHYGLRQSCLFY